MTGRVMIVTGGSSGIGYEVVKYLAEGGNDVILASKDRDRGENAVWCIKRDLPNCLVQYMEVSCSIVILFIYPLLFRAVTEAHIPPKMRWVPNANEIDTNNMKCTWPTRAPTPEDPTPPIFH